MPPILPLEVIRLHRPCKQQWDEVRERFPDGIPLDEDTARIVYIRGLDWFWCRRVLPPNYRDQFDAWYCREQTKYRAYCEPHRVTLEAEIDRAQEVFGRDTRKARDETYAARSTVDRGKLAKTYSTVYRHHDIVRNDTVNRAYGHYNDAIQDASVAFTKDCIRRLIEDIARCVDTTTAEHFAKRPKSEGL